jgi:hypothetical protein
LERKAEKQRVLNNLKKDNPFINVSVGKHSVTTLASTEADDIGSGFTHTTTNTLELNDNVKKIIKLLINELRKILAALLDSSADIERVFNLPFQQLSIDRVFNIENIHREEFASMIATDEFLRVSVYRINTY